jgi:nucleoside-diphosphate-sugar epimerase
MKATVLGATGFIGRNLAAYLRAGGHEVWTPARGDAAVFTQPLGHVFYCIGLTADFRTLPFATVRAHVGLLADVLEQADFTALVYLSSTRVYARSQDTCEQAALVVDPNDPSDLYNLSKLTGESLCRSVRRNDIKVVRLANVIGADPGSDNFLFALIREARAGRIVLQSAPASCKDYIWIDDVVRLLPQVACSGRHSLYNVASGMNLRHEEIAARLAALTGCTVAVAPGAAPQLFPVINIERLCHEFDFVPKPILAHLDMLTG